MMIKRLFDIVAAGFGLIVLSPLLVLMAIFIKLDSPGPVFYRGLRTGQYGRPFRIFKFRTMVIDAERLGGPSTAQNDPRVTRVGRFLRQYKLDEFPQLLNVLKGDMSIVGPRPEVEVYTRLYNQEEQMILSIRPGITDYASIRFSNQTELLGTQDVDRLFVEKILPIKNRLRLKYVKERTFWEDLKIIFQTLRKIFGRRSSQSTSESTEYV